VPQRCYPRTPRAVTGTREMLRWGGRCGGELCGSLGLCRLAAPRSPHRAQQAKRAGKRLTGCTARPDFERTGEERCASLALWEPSARPRPGPERSSAPDAAAARCAAGFCIRPLASARFGSPADKFIYLL